MIFAFALLEHGDAESKVAGKRVFADVVAGRRLGEVLDDAVAPWARAVERKCEEIDDFSKERFIWSPVAYASLAELEGVRASQRPLIRRRGPPCPPRCCGCRRSVRRSGNMDAWAAWGRRTGLETVWPTL